MESIDTQAAELFSRNPELCRAVARLVERDQVAGLGLTFKQQKLFDFIKEYDRRHHVAPTYLEMADHMGVVSKSNINRLVVALEDRGVIRRLPNRARAIEIVRNAA